MTPTRPDLDAARERTLPDVLPAFGQPLRVLFCGINPGLYSAATGWHFARPGNRFWPALYRSGFTPRLLAPREQHLLPGYGLGITNLAPRATAQASELTAAELRAGAERLAALAREHRPAFVAIVGVTAYRTAFARPKATTGPQPELLAQSRLWVLPNPSGLNASYQIDRLAQEFARLRDAAFETAADQKSNSRSLFRTVRGASPGTPHPDLPRTPPTPCAGRIASPFRGSRRRPPASPVPDPWIPFRRFRRRPPVSPVPDAWIPVPVRKGAALHAAQPLCRPGFPWPARQGEDPPSRLSEQAGNAGIVVFPW